MKAITDRVVFLEIFIHKVAHGEAVEREYLEIVWTDLQAIKAIAEVLPDTVHLVAEAPDSFAKTVRSLEPRRQPPERVIDLP